MLSRYSPLLLAALVACDSESSNPKDTSVAPTTTTTETDTSTPPEDTVEPDVDTAPPKPGLPIDYTTTEPGAVPLYDLAGEDWLAVGWPSDHWRGLDGHVTLSNFPSSGGLVDTYIAFGEDVLDGFGLNGAVYFRVDQALDAATLPTPADTRAPDSLVQLVDVTAGSASRGQAMPVEMFFHGDGFDGFYLPNTLAVRPVDGFPLNEGATYCAIVTRGVKDKEGRYLQQAPAFLTALQGDEPSLAALRAWLPESPLADKDIAIATCFTTQHATHELSEVADWISSQPSPELDSIFEPNVPGEFHGIYTAPNFQFGDKPYASEGGQIELDEDGAPIVQSEEEIRFLLLTPTDVPMPEDGWPVTLYAHGTGGDYESCRGDTRELIVDHIAVLCIDQPLHGSRGPAGLAVPLNENELILFSFNFTNPYAGRSNFRQAAIDTLTLSKMVADGRFTLEPGQTKRNLATKLNPERISFFGHSHGGLSGTLALAVDDRLDAAVISGMAGLIIETILRRKEPVDLGTLAANLLGVDPRDLNRFHPALTLIQTLVDATDPINYTRYWLHPMPGRNPKNVFVTEGTLDEASPSVGTDASAAAGLVPQVYPIAKISDAHELRNMQPETLPIVGNIDVGNGEHRTAALRQWQGGSHFIAFNAADARAMWRRFLYTASYEDEVELSTGAVAVSRLTPVSGRDACADAHAIPTDKGFPIEIRSNNALAGADSYVEGCAQGGGARRGEPGRDLVWRFTPPAEGTYRFRIALPTAIDKDHPRFGPDVVSVSSSCGTGAVPECLGVAQDGNLDLRLPAGEEVFVTIDGSAVTDVGPFTLVIEQRCRVLECTQECGTPAGACDSCGSCQGGEICLAGTCTPYVAGDTCDNAIEATAVPFQWTGDTRQFTDGYSYELSCADFPHIFGRTSGDGIVKFTAPAAATYLFTLEGDYDVMLYVSSSCLDPNSACLGAMRTGGRSAMKPIALTAGQVVYAHIDGASNSGNSAGRASLQIDTCVPSCEGRACGTDGCGGSCGTCADDASCVIEGGTCSIPYDCPTTARCEAIAGDTCEQAFEVGQLPYSNKQNTVNFEPQYGYGVGWCPGVDATWGFDASDVAYHFKAPNDGLFRFLLDTGNPVFDANLYLATDCSDIMDSCLAADERDRNERLWRQMDKDEEVFVIVDGWSNFGNQTGSYTLDVRECVPSCENRECGGDGCNGVCGPQNGNCGFQEACWDGTCIPDWGISCQYPRGVGDLPWKEDFTTTNHQVRHHNPCDGANTGAGSKDVVYAFQARGAGDYTFSLSANFAAQMYITRECGDAGECIASGGVGSLNVTLAEEEVVYFIVDGIDTEAGAGVEGNFTVRVQKTCVPDCEGKNCGSDGCGGACGTCAVPADLCIENTCTDPNGIAGNTCASAFEVGALPFTGEGDTRESRNEYNVDELMCPGFVAKGIGSSDQVWAFTAPTAGDYVVEVAPHNWDAIVYVLADCADPGASCVAASDTQATESVELSLGSGESVRIVVDGAENIQDDAGEYELSVRAR